MKIQQKYAPIYSDATMLLRPKTGLKDMIVELDPGHAGGGRLKDGGTIPVSQTLPDVNLDEFLAVARRRHARLPAAAARRRRRRACKGNGAEPRADAPPLRADRRDVAKINEALATRRANIKRVDPQLQPAHRRAGQQGQELAELRRLLERGLRGASPTRTRTCATTLQQLPGDAERDPDARSARPTRWPTRSARRCEALRPGARALGPSLRADAPVPAQDDADHPRPDAARSRARRCPTVKELRPALRDLARRRRPDHDASTVAQLRCSTSWPTTRRATDEGSWAVVGSTTSARRCSPPRTPTARSAAAWSCSLPDRCSAARRASPQANPQLGTLVDLLERARTHAADLPASPPQAPRRRRRLDAEAGPDARPHRS